MFDCIIILINAMKRNYKQENIRKKEQLKSIILDQSAKLN